MEITLKELQIGGQLGSEGKNQWYSQRLVSGFNVIRYSTLISLSVFALAHPVLVYLVLETDLYYLVLFVLLVQLTAGLFFANLMFLEILLLPVALWELRKLYYTKTTC